MWIYVAGEPLHPDHCLPGESIFVTEVPAALKVLGRGRRILREGVTIVEGGDWMAAEADGVVSLLVMPRCPEREGVLISFLGSRPIFSSLSILAPLAVSCKGLESTPFSPSSPGTSSSRVFRFLPRLSFVSLLEVDGTLFQGTIWRGVRMIRVYNFMKVVMQWAIE